MSNNNLSQPDLPWKRVLTEVPASHKFVLNLREMYNFIDTLSVNQMDYVFRIAAELIDEPFMRAFELISGIGIPVPNTPLHEATRRTQTDEFKERRATTTRWFNEVLKPQMFRHLDLTCIPVAKVDTPKNWQFTARSAKFGDTLIKERGKREATIWIVNEPTVIRLFFRRKNQLYMAQNGMEGFKREVFETDLFRFQSEVESHVKTTYFTYKGETTIPTENPINAVYFYHEWASEMADSIRDWMMSGECKFPRVLTKLSLMQAFTESVKWHQRVEDRKRREAERSLKEMSPGYRELLGTVTLEGVHEFTPQGKIKRTEVLTFLHLMDQDSLKYESVLQHHCVDTYWFRVFANESVIIHISDTRGGRWTAEVSGDSIETPVGSTRLLTRIQQIRGPANKDAPRYVWTGLEFWLKYMNLFIYTDKVRDGSYPSSSTLCRYPFNDTGITSSTLLSTGLLGTMIQKNSKARFDGKEHVTEIECLVSERTPFSGRQSSDKTTKYRIIPVSREEDASSASGQSTQT